MLCIFCLEEKPSSVEHIFPLALGGTVTTDRVCADCNSLLGLKVDSSFVNLPNIQMRRGQFGLSGNSRTVPSPWEFFLRDGVMIGSDGSKVAIRNCEVHGGGGFSAKVLPNTRTIVNSDGTKSVEVTLDKTEEHRLPEIVNKVRHRSGLLPMSPEQTEKLKHQVVTTTEPTPLIQFTATLDITNLPLALAKIAYQLAFLWLGESYLDDPLAARLRRAILSVEPGSLDNVILSVGVPEELRILSAFWLPCGSHHLACSFSFGGQLIIAIRIFDVLAAAIRVSEDFTCNLADQSGLDRLRFLNIDTERKRTVDCSAAEEFRRLGQLMSLHGRSPPFQDPLSDTR